MTEKITNIAKNTSYFTFALVLQKIISFTYFTLIARALGPEDLGKYYFAISFTTIFAIFIDVGLANVLTREVAKTKEQAQKLISNILAIKLPLAVVSTLAVVVFVNALGYPELTKELVYLSAICMVLDSFTLTFFAVARGFHNLSFESISSVIFQLIILSLGLVTLKLNLGIRWLMGGLAAASVFNFCYSSVLLIYKWRLKLWLSLDSNLIKLLLKITLPFAIYGVFQRFYTYLDSVLLSLLAGDVYVGLYQVAFKIINALQFLPLAFTASLYPAMSAYWHNNREQLVVTFERAMNYLIIISLPIAIGIAAIADKIVLLFTSGYQASVLPLEINMLAIIFMFLGYPVGSLLNACDRQTVNTVNMGITVTLSIVLNLILIPNFQAVGASLTVLVTNLIMLILGLYWVPKIIKYRPGKILSVFWKSALATLAMALLVIYLKNIVNLFLAVTLSGILYFVLLFILGGFKKDDLMSVYRSFAKPPANSNL